MKKTAASINFYKAIAGATAAVPGLLLLLNQITVPPSLSKGLMFALVEIFSAFIFAYALVNGKFIISLKQKQFNLSIIILILIFTACLFCYFYIHDYAIINSAKWGREILIPLFGSTSDTTVIKEGSFQNYYDEYGVADLEMLLLTHYKTPLIFTKFLIYFTAVLTFTSLTAAFTLLWLKHDARPAKQQKLKTRQ